MGSSKASFRFEASNMRGSSVSIFILGFGCILSASKDYPTPAPPPDYDPQIGQTNVDGYSPNKNPYCHMEEKVVFENQCEPYTEKTCWTQNEEDCKPVMYKNCTGVIQTKVDRVCFNVNELVCSLVEAIHYETLEERSRLKCARLMSTGIARNFLIPIPSQSRSRIVTLNPKRSASWK